MLKQTKHLICVFALILAKSLFPTSLFANSIGLFIDKSNEQIKFAANDLKIAIEAKGIAVDVFSLNELNQSYANKKIVISLISNTDITNIYQQQGGTLPTNLGEQSYSLTTTTNPVISYWVFGGDITGAMYGGLQIAENISFDGFGATYNTTEKPHLINRGVKLNVPFCKRLPTYSGFWTAKSARLAIEHVWDFKFWERLIDQQARYRYNMLTVWSHHFFPALVKVPGYEKASLPNIQKYDGTIINLNHDERVEFFRRVIRHAHNRGVKFYFFNWNVYVDYAKDHYPQLTNKQGNTATVDYMSKSMLELLKTYPELDGFGVSAGDGMYDGWQNLAKIDFTWKCYGKVVQDYLATVPTRKFDLIHRSIGADFAQIDPKFSALNNGTNTSYRYSVKYTYAHAYGTPTPNKQWSEMSKLSKATSNPNNTKTFLTFRNEDFFYFNWGNHKFVSAIMKSILFPNIVDGFYLGSDNISPTMSYLYKDKNLNKDLLEMDRKWYTEMLWGRMSYNPDTHEDVFKKTMALRYNNTSIINDLFEAWTKASAPLTKVTEMVQDKWINDYHWWPETCMSDSSASDPKRGNGFRLISGSDGFDKTKVANKSEFCSIETSAKGTCGKLKSSYIVADEMQADADKAISLTKDMDGGGNIDLEIAIQNVKQMAYLGNYYAYKIRGATYNAAGNIDEARKAMGKAYCYWIAYTRMMEALYDPEETRSVKITNWRWADAKVLKEYTDLGGIGIPICDLEPQERINIAINGCSESTTTGQGKYNIGENVTICATPAAGCEFVNWTHNNSIISTESCYTFQFSQNMNIVANFNAIGAPKHTVNVSANNAAAGTVTGGGTYMSGQTAMVMASPAAFYKFVNWTENQNGVSIEPNYSFNVSTSRSLVANFAKENCPLPYANNGISVAGVAREWSTGTINTYCASSVNVRLDVEGVGGLDASDYCNIYYRINNGAKVLLSENKGLLAKKRLTLSNLQNCKSIEIMVSILCTTPDEIYKITDIVIEGDNSLNDKNIFLTSNGCSTSKVSGGGLYSVGQEVTMWAMPGENCVFLNWTEGTEIVSNNPSYSFIVENNRTLKANFTQSTSTFDNSWNKGIKIYPNPANNILNIDIDDLKTEIDILILNNIGQVLYRKTTNKKDNKIDLNPLNLNGLIMIQIKNGHKTSTHKLTVYR